MEKIKNIIIKYKGYIICIIIIILSIISLIIQNIERKNVIKVNSNNISSNEGKIAVYITGEIKNPGVYYIDENSRINNILDIAGGVTDNADINKINLAKKLLDSEKIIIPKKQDNTENNLVNIEDDVEKEEKININTADLSELTKISGVGDATAKKIIEYRKNNQFNEIEDIMNVPGIGDAKFNAIKDSICIE